MPEKVKERETDWQASWASHDDAQLDSWLAATPAQRLAWLEEALLIAHRSGALPKTEAVDGR